MLNSITPFFIVDDLAATLHFYQDKLGFSVLHKGGGDGNNDDDFWAMVARDQVMLMFKAIAAHITPAQPRPPRMGSLGRLRQRERPRRPRRTVPRPQSPHPSRTGQHQRRAESLRDHR